MNKMKQIRIPVSVFAQPAENMWPMEGKKRSPEDSRPYGEGVLVLGLEFVV
jgi:hypothetical protein